jgi:site-specific DNA recombinase
MSRLGAKPKVRCAVYTRKSSEEGLELAFNSLDAQREACAAYVDSQRHEGWLALDDRYDDGGFSGGTLERPALQRLIRDIEAGRIEPSSATRSTGSAARSPTLPGWSTSSSGTVSPSCR